MAPIQTEGFHWANERGFLMSGDGRLADMDMFTVIASKAIYGAALLGFKYEQMARESKQKMNEAKADYLLKLKSSKDDNTLSRVEAQARHEFFIHVVDIVNQLMKDKADLEFVRRLGYDIIEPKHVENARVALNIGTEWHVVDNAPDTTSDNVDQDDWEDLSGSAELKRDIATIQAESKTSDDYLQQSSKTDAGKLRAFLGSAFGHLTGNTSN